MKRTIYINNRPFEFEDEHSQMYYENLKPITEEDARKLIHLTSSLFNEVGLTFYLAFGTLLGAVRDKGLIKNDEDVDIFIDNQEKILYESLPYFYNNGLKLCRINRGRLYSFHADGAGYIDVYIKSPLKNTVWSLYCCNLYKFVTPKRYFRQYQKIDFLGCECLCPKDPEKLLAFWYGESWRTPVRGHKFYYEVKSHYYWKHKVWPFMFELIGWPYWRHLVSKKYNGQKDSLYAWNNLYHRK